MFKKNALWVIIVLSYNFRGGNYESINENFRYTFRYIKKSFSKI